jgi:hypothetical protein
MSVTSLRVDAATSRLVGIFARRDCSIAMVAPRVDVFGARGLERLSSTPLGSRPCSALEVRGRLALVATCRMLVGIDTIDGRVRWRRSILDASRGGPVTIAASGSSIAITGRSGSLSTFTLE